MKEHRIDQKTQCIVPFDKNKSVIDDMCKINFVYLMIGVNNEFKVSSC